MSEDNPAAMRRMASHAENQIHKETREWLGTLPSGFNLSALAHSYPRILNRIALLWVNPAMCQLYLDELLFSDRGDNRQGFPPKACLEIMRLKGMVVDLHEAEQETTVSFVPNIWKNL